ncbi:MAG TPA: hypothetical protein VFA43_17175 [Gemmatimonadaceae bacterium]|nr:hypothetical protein [Gemmatimonadaceae bacterium]
MIDARSLASAGLVASLTSLVLAACASGPRPADELAAVPARAAKDSTVGRCIETRNVDIGAIGDVVEDPQQPAKRIEGVDIVARDSAYRVIAMTLSPDDDPPFGHHGGLRATAVAIVDTAGHPVPGSVVVTESDDMALTRGICDAMPHMRFRPALENGRKVRALYREEFVFYRLM